MVWAEAKKHSSVPTRINLLKKCTTSGESLRCTKHCYLKAKCMEVGSGGVPKYMCIHMYIYVYIYIYTFIRTHLSNYSSSYQYYQPTNVTKCCQEQSGLFHTGSAEAPMRLPPLPLAGARAEVHLRSPWALLKESCMDVGTCTSCHQYVYGKPKGHRC